MYHLATRLIIMNMLWESSATITLCLFLIAMKLLVIIKNNNNNNELTK